MLAALLVLALGACEREKREVRSQPAEAARGGEISLSTLYPGTEPPQAAQASAYEQNAYHLSEGERLYNWYNCNGCHAHGGGDIGPPLRDEKWIYGSEPQNIYATIVEGRPNGMPSFRGRIPDFQVWELAAYVRSLSGQAPSAAAAARSDGMNTGPGPARLDKVDPTKSSVPPSTVQTR
jgi:cytochrome c oxidase cbb3-type subunit 3